MTDKNEKDFGQNLINIAHGKVIPDCADTCIMCGHEVKEGEGICDACIAVIDMTEFTFLDSRKAHTQDFTPNTQYWDFDKWDLYLWSVFNPRTTNKSYAGMYNGADLEEQIAKSMIRKLRLRDINGNLVIKKEER